MKTRLICPSCERYKTVSAMVGTARCAVPARVVAGGTNDRVAPAIRNSCAAARGADIAARCPYHAKRVLDVSSADKLLLMRRGGTARQRSESGLGAGGAGEGL